MLGYAGTQLGYTSTCATSVVALKIETSQTAAPAITLQSPGQGALIGGGQPVFSGTAATGFGSADRVTVRVYRGGATTGSPAQTLSATRGPQGAYSVNPSSPLPDGQYTAQAEQDDLASPPDRGFSAEHTFVVHNAPPTITLGSPVFVYAGSSATGRPVTDFHVMRSGATWSGHLTHQLGPGRYTARATQTDDAGHTGRSAAHTFRIIRTPNPIGSRVELPPRGRATVSISCAAPASKTCRGSVLILTMRRFHTTAGGPSGRLRVVFAYVTIRGGRTAAVTRSVEPEVAHVLRRAAPLKVQVTASMNGAETYSKIASLIIE